VNMTHDEKPSRPQRSYPAVYEKLIPIALALIALATLAALGFAVAVATGFLP